MLNARVLLVATNNNTRMAPVPVALAFLVPPLKQRGYNVKCLDLMWEVEFYTTAFSEFV